nr:MAG TPA: hypothetical protein [Caudoviricetes sp.]
MAKKITLYGRAIRVCHSYRFVDTANIHISHELCKKNKLFCM